VRKSARPATNIKRSQIAVAVTCIALSLKRLGMPLAVVGASAPRLFFFVGIKPENP